MQKLINAGDNLKRQIIRALFGLMESDAAEWNGMDSIPFHHLPPPYFSPSDLGGVMNFPCFVLKFSNDGMEFSFRSVHFMMSKHKRHN